MRASICQVKNPVASCLCSIRMIPRRSCIISHFMSLAACRHVPVEAEVNSSGNPWRHVLELASPNDFVVAKLDIDDAATESALVQQLLDSPALSTRVDVFLYEQHWLKATRASQRACSSGSELCIAPGFHRNRHIRREQRGSTCTDVHRLFARLRSRGILAHAWY